MSEHGFYTGEQLLNLPIDLSRSLVDKIIYERDVVILSGKEKSGKSVFAQQLAFALGSGEPFLSSFKSYQSCVVYIQLEGKRSETQQRINAMRQGVSWDSRNFNLVFQPGLAINIPSGLEHLTKEIDEGLLKNHLPSPKLIVFDPLYMCVHGDLCNQEVASDTCKAFRMIADKYSSALLIIHHEHRPIRFEGRTIDEGDNSIFGSFVWKAFSDHVLQFRKVSKGHNQLTCNTQRSAKIIEKIELVYMGPEPMMFEVKVDVTPFVQAIIMQLSKEKDLSAAEIGNKCGIGYSTVMGALRYLKKNKQIERVGDGYPVKWRLK